MLGRMEQLQVIFRVDPGDAEERILILGNEPQDADRLPGNVWTSCPGIELTPQGRSHATLTLPRVCVYVCACVLAACEM